MKVDFYYPPSPPEALARRRWWRLSCGLWRLLHRRDPARPFLPLGLASAWSLSSSSERRSPSLSWSPMITAMTAWDLARMSRGRFLLGLGTQVRAHIVRRFSTTWDRPVPRLREYILALRDLGIIPEREPARLRRRLLPVLPDDAVFQPWSDSESGRADIHRRRWALSEPSGGELCSGFHVHPFHTVRYLDEVVLPGIAAGSGTAGRTIHDVELATTVFVMTGATESEVEQAMALVRQQIAFYADTFVSASAGGGGLGLRR